MPLQQRSIIKQGIYKNAPKNEPPATLPTCLQIHALNELQQLGFILKYQSMALPDTHKLTK